MVFSLLTFIAEQKQNVIFAMEEPEIALPPHTQRRIVRFLRSSVGQTILTTHSPFILEQFPPENVILLDRNNGNKIKGTRLELTDIKAKTYRGGLRRHFAEAMLGRGVICVEGVSDREVLQAASAVMEEESSGDNPYTPLDLSGVTVVQCDGRGSLSLYGKFFKSLGLYTYAFFDKQKNANDVHEIKAVFNRFWELEYAGIEKLLAEKIEINALKKFMALTVKLKDYPSGSEYKFDSNANETEIRDVCFETLRARKGVGYAERLIEALPKRELPDVIVKALNEVSQDLPNQFPNDEATDQTEQ